MKPQPRSRSEARPPRALRRDREPERERSGMAEMRVAVAGAEVVIDPAGALWLPESRTLVVADLHLEKASSFARRGMFLPPYDTGATLLALAALVLRRNPRRIVSLGDSFHDSGGHGRLTEADRARLAIAAARARVDLDQRQPRSGAAGRYRRRHRRRACARRPDVPPRAGRRRSARRDRRPPASGGEGARTRRAASAAAPSRPTERAWCCRPSAC